ncbi:uncharacterized protein LOC129409702 [Boleophthalmus pectinirostris]|uniref:uncharacterized protein LOC129409702 n=1 Tax=Boleophthalmus pectinirostris TaxID=150288 RepID=UPI00242FE5EA|nr:uncharacterized protein LOC129409702 [Boleophthalmus pectinirostris]
MIQNLENQNQQQNKTIQNLENQNQEQNENKDLCERIKKSLVKNQKLQEVNRMFSHIIHLHFEEQTKRICLQMESLEKVQMRCDEAEGEVCPHLRDLKEERQQHAQLKDSHSELLKAVTELNQEKVNLKEELETLRTAVGSSGPREFWEFIFKSYKKRMSEDLKSVENRLSEEYDPPHRELSGPLTPQQIYCALTPSHLQRECVVYYMHYKEYYYKVHREIPQLQGVHGGMFRA